MTGMLWQFALNADDLNEGCVAEVTLGDVNLAVFNLNGRFYTTSNRCTHGQAFLSEGFVIDDVIECPLHQGRFHIPTGAACGAPVTEPIRTYPTKLEDGKVFICTAVHAQTK